MRRKTLTPTPAPVTSLLTSIKSLIKRPTQHLQHITRPPRAIHDINAKIHAAQITQFLHRGARMRKADKLHRDLALRQRLRDQPICHLGEDGFRVAAGLPLAVRENVEAHGANELRCHARDLLALLPVDALVLGGFLLQVSVAVGLELQGEALGDVGGGFELRGFLFQVLAEIEGVFAAPGVVGDGEEELGAVRGHALYRVGEGLKEALYVGPDGGHGCGVVDYEDLEKGERTNLRGKRGCLRDLDR